MAELIDLRGGLFEPTEDSAVETVLNVKYTIGQK